MLVFNQLISDGAQEYRLRKMLQLQLQLACDEPHKGYHRCRERDVHKKQLLLGVFRWLATQFIECSIPIFHSPAVLFEGGSVLAFETPAVYWADRVLLPQHSLQHWTLSFVPSPGMKLSILAGKEAGDAELRSLDLVSMSFAKGSQTLSLPYSTLCPAFDARSTQLVTVHVLVDALIGYLWVMNEQGKVAGGVLTDLPTPLRIGIAASALPSGVEVGHVTIPPSDATFQFAQSVRSLLHTLLREEIAFYRAQQSSESSNQVRFYGKQMPFLLTFYLILRLGCELPAIPLSPSLLFDLLDDLQVRIDTVQRFPELFAASRQSSDRLFGGSQRFEGKGKAVESAEDGSARLRWDEQWIQGETRSFGWIFVGSDRLAVATRGFEGLELLSFVRSDPPAMQWSQLRATCRPLASLQGMRSMLLFVDLPRWIVSRLVTQAKAAAAKFEECLQGDPSLRLLLLPLFQNGWSRQLRAVLWEDALDETFRRTQFLTYLNDPEKPVKRPVLHTQDSVLLNHVQRIESAWRPTSHQIVIVETEKRSPFLNPKHAFFAITNAIYQELKAILQFHSHFENGSEVIQAANNLLRFINDDRTRNGRKWADYELLPGKLRVLLKRVFPAELSVSECQKCLKELIPQIDSLLSSLPLLYDYQSMTLRTLFAFELDSSLLLEDVSAPFTCHNHGNSMPALYLTHQVSTILQNETPIRSLCVLLQALRLAYSDSLRSLATQFLLKWEFHWGEEGNVELAESLCLVYQIIECIAGKGDATSDLIDFLLETTSQLKQVLSISLDAHVWSVEGLFSQWFHRVCFILLYSSCLTRNHLNRFISFLKLPLSHEDAEFVTSTLSLLIQNGSLDALLEFVEYLNDSSIVRPCWASYSTAFPSAKPLSPPMKSDLSTSGRSASPARLSRRSAIPIWCAPHSIHSFSLFLKRPLYVK